MMDYHESSLRQFLLGNLDEEARSHLEEELLGNESLFELTEAIDDEMVGEMLRGELAEDEARALKSRLAASRGERQLALAATLERRLDALRPAASSRVSSRVSRRSEPSRQNRPGGVRRNLAGRGGGWRIAVAAVLTTAIGLVPIAVVMQGDLRDQNRQLEDDLARVSLQRSSEIPAVKMAFALAPSTRSSRKPMRLELPASTELVELWLETPFREGAFRVIVKPPTGIGQQFDSLGVRREDWGNFVTVEVERHLLSVGLNEVELQRLEDGSWAPIGSYLIELPDI